MALLCMFVMPARCAGMKMYIPRPWSACAQALKCLARTGSQLLFQSSNTFSDLALSTRPVIVRTEFEPLTYIVRSHSSLGSRNLCQSRSEEHTSELQSRQYLVCRLLLETKKRRRSSHCG